MLPWPHPASHTTGMFDSDGDGRLSKCEYAEYLRAIGEWGRGSFTDKSWDANWPRECPDMACTTAGITFDEFEARRYGGRHSSNAVPHLRRALRHSVFQAAVPVEISGATGPRAAQVNGVYERTAGWRRGAVIYRSETGESWLCMSRHERPRHPETTL